MTYIFMAVHYPEPRVTALGTPLPGIAASKAALDSPQRRA